MNLDQSSEGLEQQIDESYGWTSQNFDIFPSTGGENQAELPNTPYQQPTATTIPSSFHNSIASTAHQATECEVPAFLLGGTQEAFLGTPQHDLLSLQQSEGMSEHIQTQEPRMNSHAFLSEEQIDFELRMEDIRHAESRSRILERSQASQTLYRQEQMTALHSDMGSHIWPDIDLPNVAYNGINDFPGVRTASDQMSQYTSTGNHGSSSFVFTHGASHMQPVLQTAPGPFPFNSYDQELNFSSISSPFLQNNGAANLHHPVDLQGPTVETIPSTILLDAPLGPCLNDHGQQRPSHHFEAPPFTYITQQPFVQNDSVMFADASMLPESFIPDFSHDMTGVPSTAELLPEGTDQSSHYTSDLYCPDMLSLPRVDAPSMPTPQVPFQRQNAVERTNGKLLRIPEVLPDHVNAAMYEVSQQAEKIPSGLENIHHYKDPVTEREFNKTRKRTRNFYGKADWACFMCWVLKGKCVRSCDGPCDRCSKLSRHNAQHTSVPKFTCDVRTKFSELTLFSVTPDGPNQTMPPPISIESALELINPFRDILDTLEPSNIRQLLSMELFRPLVYYSYSISILRWKRALLTSRPSLRCHINTLEQDHHHIAKFLLASIDHINFYRSKEFAAVVLNVLYEGVCSLQTWDAIDKPAVEHFRCALENLISNVYCIVFSHGPTVRKSRRKFLKTLAEALCITQRTTRFMPPQYRYGEMVVFNRSREDSQQDSSCSEQDSYLISTYQDCRKAPEKSPCVCSWLSLYVTTGILAPFGLDKEAFYRRVHDAEDVLYLILDSVVNKFRQVSRSRDIVSPIVDTVTFGVFMSMILQAYFHTLATEGLFNVFEDLYSSGQHELVAHMQDQMLVYVITLALYASDIFLHESKAQATEGGVISSETGQNHLPFITVVYGLINGVKILILKRWEVILAETQARRVESIQKDE